MKYKKLLMIPLAATLLLGACGEDDGNSKGEPGKISGQQTQKDLSDNKDSSKQQKGEAKTSDKHKSDNDSKEPGDQETKKDEESKNKILADGVKSEKYGKSKPTAKNDIKKLPKDIQKSDVYLENQNYSDLHGDIDIDKAIENRVIENPNKVATDSQHDHAYDELKRVNNDVSKYNKKHGKDTGVTTNNKDLKDLVRKDFYSTQSGTEDFIKYNKAGWKMDQSSLKLTDYGAENVWMYQIDWVDKNGKKQAVMSGKFYDVINQFTIEDSMTSNNGATQLIRDMKKEKGQNTKY